LILHTIFCTHIAAYDRGLLLCQGRIGYCGRGGLGEGNQRRSAANRRQDLIP
jgi:hypothetical protein